MNADIVIIGAGMVGSLLAAALAPLDLDIVLVDPARVSLPEPDAAFEPRVSALTRASENMLRQVGAWGLVSQHRHCPITTMHVTEQDGRAGLHFAASDLNESHLGCLVENRLLQWALTEVATRAAGVRYLAPERLTHLERFPRHWRVSLAGGETIDTPLVIGADGAQSLVRQQAAIGVDSWDYHQQGIVCTIRTERGHAACARQVFLRSGPLALLPLAQAETCSIVWSADNTTANGLLSLSDAEFRAALTRVIAHDWGETLGQVVWNDQRHAFPLVARHAERYTGEGLALIGDAAHTIHPLAGQGVNLGFLDAAVLAEEVGHALRRGLPLGHAQALQRYSRRRRGHNALLMHGMTGLERLYAASLPALVQLRNEGVGFVNGSGWLKNFFEQRAMGLAGDLPLLAR